MQFILWVKYRELLKIAPSKKQLQMLRKQDRPIKEYILPLLLIQEAYIQENQPLLRQLIKALCAIPAPSHHEEKRAAYVKAWLESHGAEGVYIDEVQNVIWPMGVTEDNDITVFMAHTDTVFRP